MLDKKYGVGKFILIFIGLNLAIYQWPLYLFAAKNLENLSTHSILTFATLLIVIILLSVIFLFLLAIISQKLLKGFCILTVLINAIALYFLVSYQVILDRSMMGNIFHTNTLEALDYWHPKLLIYLLFLGIFPAWLLLKVSLNPPKRLRLIWQMLLIITLCLAWIYLNASSWLWFDKHSKRLGAMILPWSYVLNTARFYSRELTANKAQKPLPNANFDNTDKAVVILVIGETARAQNFSLYDYNRPTNPLLANSGAKALKNTVSCATYTTESVGCILANTKDTQDFEPLPSYLQRQGVAVIWRSNNWGEPKIKVTQYQSAASLRANCSSKYCAYDEVLLTGLAAKIQATKQQKILIILHTSGSHGPAYYKKYPQEFTHFKPVCRSVNLQQCPAQSLINAYDNTILYTDYFLNNTIDLLKTINNAQTTMFYISDHGESLGENGLYLHGLPLALAPEVQKNIPFIIWQSDINKTILNPEKPHGQHQIFHSIMGRLGLSGGAYNSEYDIFQ